MYPIPFDDIIKIQPKGLITIPAHLRRELGFSENSLARLKKERGRLILEPVRTLPYPVRSYTDQEIDEFFALDDEETQMLRRARILK